MEEIEEFPGCCGVAVFYNGPFMGGRTDPDDGDDDYGEWTGEYDEKFTWFPLVKAKAIYHERLMKRIEEARRATYGIAVLTLNEFQKPYLGTTTKLAGFKLKLTTRSPKTGRKIYLYSMVLN